MNAGAVGARQGTARHEASAGSAATALLASIALLALGACTSPLGQSQAASTSVAAPTVAADAPSLGSPTTTAPTSPTTAPVAAPVPAAAAYLLAEGATGHQVRELQARLKQLKHYTATVDGVFAAGTTAAVRAYQNASQSKGAGSVTGSVDQATWDTLVAATRTPTAEELAGRLLPGPAILQAGSTGTKVRELQARLKQLSRWSGDVTSTYGPTTTKAVSGFQTSRRIPVTGEVDQRTWDRLTSMTRRPTANELNNVTPAPVAGLTTAGLDPRCLVGRVICASKTTRKVVWVVDGVAVARLDARFGRPELPTGEGTFRIYLKSRDHWSKQYDAAMPFALFFNGGEAVHYSPEFASIGYRGVGSHGCVNTRDKAKMAWLFDQAQIGDKVVVYR